MQEDLENIVDDNIVDEKLKDLDSVEENNQQENTENNEEKSELQNDKQNDQQKNLDGDIYGAPEQFDYSDIKLPEGMTLDKELLEEFEPIAKKFNLSNKSANELLGLAVKLSEKNISIVQDAIQQSQIAEKNSYMQMLDQDIELNVKDSAQYEQYLSVASKGIKAVATPKFKEFIKDKGLTHHPEFIKVFHKIGQLCTEVKIPDGNPSGKDVDAADVLYGKRQSEE